MEIKIIKSTKDELTKKGFTNKIKIHPSQTKEKLLQYGFTNYNPERLYFCRMLDKDISFNLSIDINTLEILEIDILDEDFLQPYDYQSSIIRGNPSKMEIRIFKAVNKLLTQLQEDGVIIGFTEGMYV